MLSITKLFRVPERGQRRGPRNPVGGERTFERAVESRGRLDVSIRRFLLRARLGLRAAAAATPYRVRNHERAEEETRDNRSARHPAERAAVDSSLLAEFFIAVAEGLEEMD